MPVNLFMHIPTIGATITYFVLKHEASKYFRAVVYYLA